MKNRRSWVWVLVAAGMVGAMGVMAEEGGGAAKKESTESAKVDAAKKEAGKEEARKQKETEKAEAHKKHAAEEMQKRVVEVKKQIADKEAAIEKMTKMMADQKDEDMRPYLEKQMDYHKKSLDLLKQLQAALEGQNREQAEKIYAEVRDLNMAWGGVGEATARIGAERAKAKRVVGDNPSPEAKAALDAFNAACDGWLKAMEKRQSLEKELKATEKESKDLYLKQREAMEKLHKEAQAAKHKEHKEKEKKEAKKEQDKK